MAEDEGDHHRHAEALVRRVGLLELAVERGQVVGPAALAAELDRHGGGEPATVGDRLHQRPVVVHAGAGDVGTHVGVDGVGDDLAHLLAEGDDLGVRREVHRQSLDEIAAAGDGRAVEHIGEVLVLVLGIAELQRPALGTSVVELRVVLGHHAVPTVVVHRG